MSNKDYIESFKDGIGFMSKVASAGVSKISKQMKGDEKIRQTVMETGLFYQRHVNTCYGELIPKIEFYESADLTQLGGSFVAKMARSAAEKSFIPACFTLLFGDNDLALEKLKDVCSIDPQFTDAYFLSGTINLTLRKFNFAIENFSKCRLITNNLGKSLGKFLPSFRLSICVTDNLTFSFFPDIIGLNLLLAISQRNGGRLNEAIVTLEQVLSVMPDSMPLIFFLTAFYYEAGWDDKIVNLLKDIMPETNIQLLSIQFLVNSWLKKRSFNLAEGVTQKALESKEADPYLLADIRMLLGETVQLMGRKAEGHAYISKVKKVYPNYQRLDKRLGLNKDGCPLAEIIVDEPAGQIDEAAQAQPASGSGRTEVVAEPKSTGMTEIVSEPERSRSLEPGLIRLRSKDNKVNIPLPESLVIGREEGDLVIDWDGSASREHARILFEKGQIWVEDMGSTNGTWINKHRISNRRVLNFGDSLLIGKTDFYLE